MKTHIPDHAAGRTYCGRALEPANGLRGPLCIDLRNTAIEDATCTACQRSDDRRQAEIYWRERYENEFLAACRWATDARAVALHYSTRRRCVIAFERAFQGESWIPHVLSYEDLALTAQG